MATRLYFSDTIVGEVTGVSGAAGWSNAAGMSGQFRLLARTKLGDALTNRTVTETNTIVSNVGLRAHVSEPLAAQNIAGTFSAVIRGLESATTADDSLQVIVRVVSNDGATTRATLYAGHSAALNTTAGALGQEFATTAATRLIPSGTALSSYTCVNGDRLSVETGIRTHDTSATSASTTLRYGHPPGTADFALTAALTTDLVPWVEFSANIVWVGSAPYRNVAALHRASQTRTTTR